MATTRNTEGEGPASAAVAPMAGLGRRLTARSVLASTLLGVSPPALPTRSLVATAELLGVAPGTARVALSRMVTAGELEATADGYRLVGRPLLARQDRQGLSRRGAPEPWDGTWRTAVVTAEARPAAERALLREATAALRYGELREGVWLRPANLPTDVLPRQAALVAERCTLLTSLPEDPVELATRLWELPAWSDRANELQAAVDVLAPRLAAHDATALADGFGTSAAVLRHLQADPLLPADLLPAAWPGHRLRSTHRTYDEDFKATLATWLRAHR